LKSGSLERTQSYGIHIPDSNSMEKRFFHDIHVKRASNVCENDGFKPSSEKNNTYTGKINYSMLYFHANMAHFALCINDKYSVSDTAFHELSMMSDLPNT